MSITAEYFDGSNWVEFRYNGTGTRGGVQVEQGLFEKLAAPRATIETDAQTPVGAGDQIRLKDPSGTVFFDQATARSSGEYGPDGRRSIEVRHRGWALCEDQVTFGPISQDSQAHLQAVLDNADIGGEFTLSFLGTADTFEFEADDRGVRTVIRDILAEGDLVAWFALDSKTLVVDDRNTGTTWQSLATESDDLRIERWETGDVATVVNRVVVEPTAGIGFFDKAVATDATSISEYGRRSRSARLLGIATQSIAQTYAESLLQPDPLGEGEFATTAGDFYQSLVGDFLEVTDDTRNLSNENLYITKQTITPQQVTLEAGERGGVLLERSNRDTQSTRENSVGGTVMPEERIDDGAISSSKLVDTAVTEAKLADLSVSLQKLQDGAVDEAKLADLAVATSKLQNNAVINGKLDDLSVSETKIQDDSISTPKIQTEAVTATEIKADTITAAEIAAGTITALEIAAETITANELDAGSVDTSELVADAVTATEILADTITANEIAADTITALEIAADTITANEIDVLDLDTGELSVGDQSTGDTVDFLNNDFLGLTVMTIEPSGVVALGEPTSLFDFLYVEDIVSEGGSVAIGSGAALGSVDDGEVEIAPAASSNTIQIEGLTPGPTIAPDADFVGALGVGDGTTATRAWTEIHTHNLYEYSPAPLASDASPGPDHIDPDELLASSWADPPAYVSQKKVVTERDPETGEPIATTHEPAPEGTVEIGALANYLLETCKVQQERIDGLEERLSALEQQV